MSEKHRLIWVCTVCLRPKNEMLGLYGLSVYSFITSLLLFAVKFFFMKLCFNVDTLDCTSHYVQSALYYNTVMYIEYSGCVYVVGMNFIFVDFIDV